MIKQGRIQALDITRGIAVFGMIFMNFKIALLMDIQESLNYSFFSAQEGRFGALFVFMAGTGIPLMNRKAQTNPVLLKNNRIRLLKRALFLFVLGMVFSLFWQPDIFHFYAFYILISLPFIRAGKKLLWFLAVLPPIISFILNYFVPWETGWDWQTLQYRGFYHPVGFIRNLFFNGFHPVFPWISFLFMGMAVGKSNLNIREKQWISAMVAAIVLLGSELISFFALSGIQSEELKYFFSTRALPAFPLFVISAGAQNILILNVVLLFIHYFRKENRISVILREIGKMVMSHYIFHLVIGLVPLLFLKSFLEWNTLLILIYSACFFIFSVVFTMLWRRNFKHGPFESLMRKIAG